MKRETFGASIRGATHKKNGKPCQDYLKSWDVSERLQILSVADGHGSDQSPKSDQGSQIAAEAFCNTMRQYLLNFRENPAELVTFLNREGSTTFAQDVCRKWHEKVVNEYGKEYHKDLKQELSPAEQNEIYKLYGSTLLGLLITDTYVFAFQIGDGDIMRIDSNGATPVVESEKILGTETHSLSSPNAWRNAVSSVWRRKDDEGLPYMYMLTTDGFANSYTSDEEFRKTCQGYFDTVREHGVDAVKGNLEKWLNETSEFGCGDDITALISYYSAE